MATQVGLGWRGALQQQQQSASSEQPGMIRTRDLLGGSLHKEIDIDLDVEPISLSGWEKRLDMKSGKVYFHNCNAKDSATQSTTAAVHDLNFPPCPAGDSSKVGSPKFCEFEWLNRVAGERIEEAAVRPLEELNFMGKAGSINDRKSTITSVDLESRGEKANELKLNLNLGNQEGGSEWQSVCTLDKVKMALKRAEKDSGKRKNISVSQLEFGQSSSWGKTRSIDRSPSLSSSSCSSLGLSLHNSGDCEGEGDFEGEGDKALQAAGCPRCLVYVLLPKANPKCPRCGYLILLNRDLSSFKRPRLHAHTDREEAQSHGVSSTVKAVASSLPFDLNSVI